MTSKQRVLNAFGRGDGFPDRTPFQFDLCRSLTDHFAAKYSIEPDYAISYYEDLTYRISANAIRTRLGSDVVVVGGQVSSSFEPQTVTGNIKTNEFGMHMMPTALYVEVVKAPLEGVSSPDEIAAYDFPDPYAPARFEAAKRDIETFGSDYFIIGDVEISIFELAWHLTGMEHYLIGMAGDEAWIDALNDRVEAWSTGLASQLVRLGVDAIWFGEDLGPRLRCSSRPIAGAACFGPDTNG